MAKLLSAGADDSMGADEGSTGPRVKVTRYAVDADENSADI